MDERSSSFIRDNQDSHHLTEQNWHLSTDPVSTSLSVPTQVNQICLSATYYARTAFRLLR